MIDVPGPAHATDQPYLFDLAGKDAPTGARCGWATGWSGRFRPDRAAGPATKSSPTGVALTTADSRGTGLAAGLRRAFWAAAGR